MGTLDTVYKQVELSPNQQGTLFLEEAIEFEGSGSPLLAKDKYIQAIDMFRLVLTSRPHDVDAREGLIKCWEHLAMLDVGQHRYTFPEDLDDSDSDFPAQTMGFSLIKTILVDAFVEKDWRKQCDGKYGGPKPFNLSWKLFYFDNEEKFEKIKTRQDKLIWAVKRGHYCLIQYLFQNKDKSLDVNIRVTEEKEATLLELAVRFNYIKVVQLLIDYGIKVNSKGDLKWTPLHWAVQSGNLSMVQLLVNQGARINVKEKNGLMPLHIAAMNGYSEILGYLIEKKAKVNTIGDKHHLSPLQLAVYRNHYFCVEQLINCNADVNSVDGCKRTLLHWAVANGKNKIAELLLKKVAVNSIDDMGRTPLHWASQVGNIDLINDLIENKGKIDIKDKFGDTPLKIAAFSGHTKEVLLLFEHCIRT